MWVADPDFATDKRIVRAFDYAVNNGCTHYFPAKGFDGLTLPKAIAGFYADRRGITLDPAEEICVTHGAQEGLSLSVQATMRPGDEVVVVEPTYNGFIEKLEVFGVKPVYVPLMEDEGWSMDCDAVRSAVTEKTRMIYVCNPNNPTGSLCSRAEADELTNVLMENPAVTLLLDECYSRILYDGAVFRSLADDRKALDRVCLVDSFSKSYSMTGWRLGYVVTCKERAAKIKRLSFEYNGGVSYAVQYAGSVALNECSSFVGDMVSELDGRRKEMLSALSGIHGIRYATPRSGFEVFPDLSAFSSNSSALCASLEREAGVKTMPGVRYGPHGEGHLRLVFCSENRDRIREGVSKIGAWLEKVPR